MFSSTRGCLFVAARGCGCYEIPLHILEDSLFDGQNSVNEGEISAGANSPNAWKRLQVTPSNGTLKTPSQATFCLGVERGFSDPKGTILKIAQIIHGPNSLTTTTEDGVPDILNSFRIDGQGKYGLLARGDAEYFLRLPKDGYVDWVWDVAAGYVVLTEAGGTMTDVNGCPIDFSDIGVEGKAKLPDGVKGLLGSCGGVFHDALLEAYAAVEQGE